MRTLVNRFATLVVALVVLAFPALGQKPLGGSVAGMLPLGSVTQAETYLATNTYWIGASFFQKINGQSHQLAVVGDLYLPWGTSGNDGERPKNKPAIECLFSKMLSDCAKKIESDGSVETQTEINFWVTSGIADLQGNGGYGFDVWGSFRIGGEIVLPPLRLPDPIPVIVPGIRWARIEIWPTGQAPDATVWDYRLDPATDPVDPYSEVLLVPLMVLDQRFETKISIFVDSFELFDGKGIAIEETPFKTEIEKGDNTLVIKVLGGDSGRAFRLVSRASLASGQSVPLTTALFVPPVYQPSVAAYVPASGSMRFYQVETLEVPPK